MEEASRLLRNKVYFSGMLHRREGMTPDGRRVNLRRGGWQRCWMEIRGDQLSTWLAGGIGDDDTDALAELCLETALDRVALRFVHVQRSAAPAEIILHYTRGHGRICLTPVQDGADDAARMVEAWFGAIQRAIREATLCDQHQTANQLRAGMSRIPISGLQWDASGHLGQATAVLFRWPGLQTWCAGWLVVGMRPGWRDTRVVSRRCVCVYRRAISGEPVSGTVAPAEIDTQGNLLGRIATVSAVYATTAPISDKDGSQSAWTVVVEGNAQWTRNDKHAVPTAERILFAVADAEQQRRLLLFLRDVFEVVLPRRMLAGLSTGGAPGDEIETQPIRPAVSDDKFTRLIGGMVEARPWSRLPCSVLYTTYRTRMMTQSDESACLLSPAVLIRRMKSLGFCLKASETRTLSAAEMEAALSQAEREGERSDASLLPFNAPMLTQHPAHLREDGWFWFHLALRQPLQ